MTGWPVPYTLPYTFRYKAVPVKGPSLNDIVHVFSCCILTWKALTVMLPAFALAGAITVFIPPTLLLRHFGAGGKRAVAYGVASVSGFFLAVCSCNIVPLFRSIYRRGAGLGPAVTFLYAGPAIHLVTLVFTYRVIGLRIALWRAIAVPVIAVIVGLLMSLIFRREEAERQQAHAASPVMLLEGHPTRRLAPFFASLVTLMLVGGVDEKQIPFLDWPIRIAVMVTLAGLAAIMALKWFDPDEWKEWGIETWKIVRLTVPIVLVSVLVIGYIAQAVPLTTLKHLGLTDEGGHSVRSALAVSAFGAFMYFPVLSEVAFVKAFLKLGSMPPSLGLILLLTGAGLSLPGQILILRAVGWKKLAVYVVLVVVLAAATGMIFDHFVGQYICPCTDAPAPSL